MTFSIALLPLIIGGFFNMVLGALWYSNVLFSKPWMEESGVTEKSISDTDSMGTVYGLTSLMAIITSYVIGFLITNLNITDIFAGIIVAIILWLGMDLPMIFKNWGFEGRTIKLGLINHSYQLVVYILLSVLFIVL